MRERGGRFIYSLCTYERSMGKRRVADTDRPGLLCFSTN